VRRVQVFRLDARLAHHGEQNSSAHCGLFYAEALAHFADLQGVARRVQRKRQ
jgi:hypothetical protein